MTVGDEYDVQDLLHALLRVHFEDIRVEEWTPSYAGSSSRADFLLKDEQIVIETKKARPSLTRKALVDQLVVDKERYRTHPDCRSLFCLIYDPEETISNPVAVERDLELKEEAFEVIVLVVPQG